MGPELTLGLAIGTLRADPVSREVMEALTEVNVRTGSSGPSGFDLKFAVSTTSPLVTSLLPNGYFDPPSRVIISVTLHGVMTVLIDGVITHHEMSPSDEPGKSVLSIKGDDLTRMMDLVELAMPYPALPPEARIAVMLAKYAALYGVVPLIMPSVLLDVSNPLETIPTQWMTDLAYIKFLADIVGYTFYLQAGPTPGLSMAYWGPQLRTAIPFLPTPPPIYIDWDAHSNVESLGFAFDGFAATLWLVYIQTEANLIIPIPIPNVNPISPPLASKMPLPLKIKQMSGTDKYSPIQAAGIGLAAAAAGANVVSGQGSLDVSRYGAILPARCLVEVHGAGITYDGQYFVDSVTHTIKAGSYKQSFTLSRNALVASGAAGGPGPGPLAPQQLSSFATTAAAASASPSTGVAPDLTATLPPLPGPGPVVTAPTAPTPPNTLIQQPGRVATLPASPTR
jgi:hypothetical protein